MARGKQMLKKKFDKFGISKNLKCKRSGQGLVEFALILPIVLVAFFTIIELARVYHAWVAVENGARFGVRYAITGELDESKCGGGTCDNDSEEETARVSTVKDVAWAGSESIIRLAMGTGTNTTSGYFDVTVCEPDNLVGPGSQFDTFDCTSGETAGDPGDHVAVVVEYNHPLIVPVISSIVPQIRLTAQRESTVETFRDVKSEDGPGSDPPAPQPSLTPPPTTTLEPPATESSYDYCANIEYVGDNHPNDGDHSADDDVIFWDQTEEYDKMWKFAFEIFNNNEVSMYLTDYWVDWSGDVDLSRTNYGSSTPPSWTSHKIVNKKRSGVAYCYTSASAPKRHCDPNSNIEFFSRPGCPDDCYPQEIYNMFCKNYDKCNYNEPWSTNTNYVMTGTNYSFSAEATFTFLASDTGEDDDIDCVKTWSASGNAPDHCVGGCGGGGGYDPPDIPDPPDGGGGGGGGEDPTPDPDPPGD
jgi:hypothetical protein